MTDLSEDLEFIDEDDSSVDPAQVQRFAEAVLFSTDWTVETILSQLERGNIDLNPRFQRRDAWSLKNKSRFIESVILGLPIPQIVLAEKRNQRGNFIVLDGKQRLLTLMQFAGKAQGGRNNFALSALEARPDLVRKRYSQLSDDPALQQDLNAFSNHTIRTVVIRNWPNNGFLHLVFLRLNTGSVKLSPQELRQAMVPGPFSDFVDDWAVESTGLKVLLSRHTPDPRMRDVELLVRHLSFINRLNEYAGRMKAFLDDSCEVFNSSWSQIEPGIRRQAETLELVISALVEIFGTEIARKAGSRSFNRAIFDTLAFFAADERIRRQMVVTADSVRQAYAKTLVDPDFTEAVESDTAGIPHTHARLAIWGAALQRATNLNFGLPNLEEGRIRFDGLWR
jgi:hypothetical protein